MKNRIYITLIAALVGTASFAQVKAPQPSPAAKIEQTVGLTDFSIEYSRPGAKGRTVFGDLVPYDQLWRTGANKCVQFAISSAIKVEGKDLAQGTYALFTKPGEKSWDIIFYKETEFWGTPDPWVDSLEALRVSVQPITVNDLVESFTISLDDVSNGTTAVLNLSWEKTKVAVKIEVPTEDIAMASIDEIMAGPSANDYYRAATYYHENGKDLKKAYEWIKKATEMKGDEAFWMTRRQALIEADLGDKKAAIETAKRSLEAAKKAKYDNYVKMNEESIKEWSK